MEAEHAGKELHPTGADGGLLGGDDGPADHGDGEDGDDRGERPGAGHLPREEVVEGRADHDGEEDDLAGGLEERQDVDGDNRPDRELCQEGGGHGLGRGLSYSGCHCLEIETGEQ